MWFSEQPPRSQMLLHVCRCLQSVDSFQGQMFSSKHHRLVQMRRSLTTVGTIQAFMCMFSFQKKSEAVYFMKKSTDSSSIQLRISLSLFIYGLGSLSLNISKWHWRKTKALKLEKDFKSSLCLDDLLMEHPPNYSRDCISAL